MLTEDNYSMFHMKVLDVLTLGPPSQVIPDRTRDNSNIHQHWPELNLDHLEVCLCNWCVINRLIVTMSFVLGAAAAAVSNNKDLVSNINLFRPYY